MLSCYTCGDDQAEPRLLVSLCRESLSCSTSQSLNTHILNTHSLSQSHPHTLTHSVMRQRGLLLSPIPSNVRHNLYSIHQVQKESVGLKYWFREQWQAKHLNPPIPQGWKCFWPIWVCVLGHSECLTIPKKMFPSWEKNTTENRMDALTVKWSSLLQIVLYVEMSVCVRVYVSVYIIHKYIYIYIYSVVHYTLFWMLCNWK